MSAEEPSRSNHTAPVTDAFTERVVWQHKNYCILYGQRDRKALSVDQTVDFEICPVEQKTIGIVGHTYELVSSNILLATASIRFFEYTKKKLIIW